ncbi:hypothetical protein A3A70_00635 [candidate division WWE3 bacterium RIFCSPLOWO2_01_FULL_42_11]|uniref:VWFA domain-containing protein n=1 Tax=candidate division WWE3 bacterium RIFCSPLOWO2_01_FULL_42_11 TaxID=1802627 RepID=A0A1F4VQD6_UNCKA|nr:MAG: hypothetical protein A3A70_00635 [candidate division WWE3 bacterium RIFCSPLOWO2_01_FULL_42_11]
MINKRNLAILGIILLLAAIPVTLFISKKVQQYFGGAAPAPQEVCRKTVDIALVIDMSTSMLDPLPEGGNKQQAAINAAKQFVAAMDLNPDGGADKVAIVEFNNDARILQPLTSNQNDLENAIDSLEMEEYTNIPSGILAGQQALTGASQPKQMVILSDGIINLPPGDPNRYPIDNSLDYLKRTADTAKGPGQNIIISAVYFNPRLTPLDIAGFTQLGELVVSQPAFPDHLFSSNLSTSELVAKMIQVAGLITECDCKISTVVRVENVANPGVPINIIDNQVNGDSLITPSEGDVVSSIYDYFDVTTQPGKAQIDAIDWQLPPSWRSINGASNRVRVTDIPTGTKIVEQFCDDASGLNSCPVGFSGTKPVNWTSSSIPENFPFTNFNLQCNADITYGWRIATEAAPTYVCDAANFACVQTTNPNDTRTSCTLNSGAGPTTKDSECVKNVCNIPAQTCTTEVGIDDPKTACTGNAQCVPTGYVCEQKACVVSTGAGDTRQPCTLNPGAGPTTTDTECVKNVCDTSAQTCTVEVAKTDTRTACTGNAQCVPVVTDYVCDAQSFACVVKSGPNDTRTACTLNPGAGPSTKDTECVKNVCNTTAKTCTVEIGIDDPKLPCANDAACATPVTYYDCDRTNKVCVQKTADNGVIPPDAINCNGNNDLCVDHYECDTSSFRCLLTGGPLPAGKKECSGDKECIPTYHQCDRQACVEFIGSKANTCNPDSTDPNQCKPVCDPTKEVCDVGVSGASVGMAVVLGLMILGALRLLLR